MKTPLIALALVAVLFALEQIFPLRRTTRALVGRLMVNLALSALTFAAAFLLVKPAALRAMHWSDARPFGLLHLLTLPEWLRYVLAFLLLDLAFYYWHVLNHRVPFLWRFHNVHHYDPDLDVSTGFRFHFGEVAFSTVFRVVQVALLGVSLPQFAAYEILFQASTLFHHSNVRLPERLEHWLNLVFVSPRMHGVHHSQIRAETDSNFSVVFSFWDRLHRSLRLNVPQDEIKIGVPGYAEPGDNRVLASLTAPFRAQRDYWPDETQRRQDAKTRGEE